MSNTRENNQIFQGMNIEKILHENSIHPVPDIIPQRLEELWEESKQDNENFKQALIKTAQEINRIENRIRRLDENPFSDPVVPTDEKFSGQRLPYYSLLIEGANSGSHFCLKKVLTEIEKSSSVVVIYGFNKVRFLPEQSRRSYSLIEQEANKVHLTPRFVHMALNGYSGKKIELEKIEDFLSDCDTVYQIEYYMQRYAQENAGRYIAFLFRDFEKLKHEEFPEEEVSLLRYRYVYQNLLWLIMREELSSIKSVKVALFSFFISFLKQEPSKNPSILNRQLFDRLFQFLKNEPFIRENKALWKEFLGVLEYRFRKSGSDVLSDTIEKLQLLQNENLPADLKKELEETIDDLYYYYSGRLSLYITYLPHGSASSLRSRYFENQEDIKLLCLVEMLLKMNAKKVKEDIRYFNDLLSFLQNIPSRPGVLSGKNIDRVSEKIKALKLVLEMQPMFLVDDVIRDQNVADAAFKLGDEYWKEEITRNQAFLFYMPAYLYNEYKYYSGIQAFKRRFCQGKNPDPIAQMYLAEMEAYKEKNKTLPPPKKWTTKKETVRNNASLADEKRAVQKQAVWLKSESVGLLWNPIADQRAEQLGEMNSQKLPPFEQAFFETVQYVSCEFTDLKECSNPETFFKPKGKTAGSG